MENFSANAATKQPRGRPFKKGQSGNPTGKKPGTRCHASLVAEALIDGEVEAISRKAIQLALEGNMPAIQLLMSRLLPPKKDIPIQIALPIIRTSADTVDAVVSIVNAVACGKITPSQGQAMTAMISDLTHAIEVHEIAARLAALEQRIPE